MACRFRSTNSQYWGATAGRRKMAPHHKSLWLCSKVLLETLKMAPKNIANVSTCNRDAYQSDDQIGYHWISLK